MQWADQVLETYAVGAKMSFNFKGKGVALDFDFGKTASEFKYRLDDGEWMESQRAREWWMGDIGQHVLTLIGGELDSIDHHIEIKVIHGDKEGCTGTNFRLVFIGVIE